MKTNFTETQYFRQWWIWLLVIFIDAGVVFAFIAQKMGTESGGIEPISIGEIILISTVSFLLTGMLVFTRLLTRIDDEGIHVKFSPFHIKEKHFPWEEIASATVRTYQPIREYGGWGLKFGFSGQGKAYNVSGNVGLQIERRDGYKLLIGTLKGDEITEILKERGY